MALLRRPEKMCNRLMMSADFDKISAALEKIAAIVLMESKFSTLIDTMDAVENLMESIEAAEKERWDNPAAML